MTAPGDAAGPGDLPRIVQIVPFRTSRNDGIGDYARLLAEGFQLQAGLPTAFLSGTPAGVRPPPDDRWPTIYVRERSAAALDEALIKLNQEAPTRAIIVHISPYGYQSKGLPLWLLRGLNKPRQASGCAIIGVFHELYAHGSANTKAFWLGLLQKMIARKMLNIIDFGLTTNTYYLNKLIAWRADMSDRLAAMPVFSTIGEPPICPPVAARPRRLVAFVGAGMTRLAQTHTQVLSEIIKRFQIDEIHDIGARSGPQIGSVCGAPVTCHGVLEAAKVSEVLLGSRVGILPYANMQVMGKSTILAAYAAHGVAPFALDPIYDDADGLKLGVNYMTGETLGAKLESVQSAIEDWYKDHSLATQVARMSHFLRLGPA